MAISRKLAYYLYAQHMQPYIQKSDQRPVHTRVKMAPLLVPVLFTFFVFNFPMDIIWV